MHFLYKAFRKACFWAALLCLFLTSCGSTHLNTFSWAVDVLPQNLDPQTVSNDAEITAVSHLFTGLYRKNARGEAEPAAAESCSVSSDGLTYTFTLGEGDYLGYRNKKCDYTLTSDDFLFALQRVFSPETGSPWAGTLGNIKNSSAVLSGEASLSELGVSAPDAHTLVITLEKADADFVSKLCCPGALPCSRAFFESTGGTYGLTSASTMGNGPFYLYNWTESGLFIRRKTEGTQINNLRIILKSELEDSSDKKKSGASSLTADELVSSEKVSACVSDTPGTDGSSLEYQNCTWVILYNTAVDGLSEDGVRQGLSAVAGSTDYPLSGGYSAPEGLVPPDVTLNGESYREQAGNVLFAMDDASAAESFKAGLASAGLSGLKNITVLVPEGQAEAALEPINQRWQSVLSSFFTVSTLSVDEVKAAVAAGDYQIAVLPLTPTDNDPLSLPEQLLTEQPGSWYSGSIYKTLLQEKKNYTAKGKAGRCAVLEKQLLAACPVIPLYYGTSYLITAPDVQDLYYDPFENTVSVLDASLQS